MKPIALFIIQVFLCPGSIIAQIMGGLGNNGKTDWDLNVVLFVMFIYPLAHLIVFIIQTGRKETSNYPFVVSRLIINLITILMISTRINRRNYKGIYLISGLMLLVIFSINGVLKILKHKGKR